MKRPMPVLPVASVEELDLQPAEEAFHYLIAGRAAFLRHWPRDLIALAALDPSRTAVMTFAGAVTYRVLARIQCERRLVKHGVHELGVGGD